MKTIINVRVKKCPKLNVIYVCIMRIHKISGDNGSVNMTAAMLGQMSLSVRPPCVISLKLEQIGEVSQKNKCLIKGSLPLAVYSLRVNTDSPATDQR